MTPRCPMCGGDLHGLSAERGICTMHTEGSAEGARIAGDFFHRGIEPPETTDTGQTPIEWLEVASP